MSRVAVLGAGAWGTALAKVLADKGEDVRMWSWLAAEADEVERDGENKRYLPGVPLPKNLRATSDLAGALADASLVVLVVPSHAFRQTLVTAKPHIDPSATLVSATKGIENESLMLMSELIEDELGADVAARAGYLSGPSFAKEVATGIPTNVVIAAKDHDLSIAAQKRFASERFRVYSSDDPAGVEVGGALKNVIAIAAGACDALGFGHNTRAALITRGLAEIARVAKAKGGQQLTLSGLAGMGDLVLTCTGDLSRNRTVGVEMGKGRKLDEVLKGLGHVAEGVKTAKSAYDLANELEVELPICFEVYRVLYEEKPPLDAVRDVLTRPLKKEFW